MTTTHAARPRTPIKVFAVLYCLFSATAWSLPLKHNQPTAAGCTQESTDLHVALIESDTSGRVTHEFDYNPGYYTYYGIVAYQRFMIRRTWITYGFIRFRLDSLPDAALIESAELCYSQYELLGTAPVTSARLIPDPAGLDPLTLFQTMESATEVTPSESSPNGPKVRRLDANGVAAIDSCRRTNQSISFGLWLEDLHSPTGAKAYGYDSQDPPYLRITYLPPDETDIQAVRAEFVTYPLVAQSSDTALLTLTNKGLRTSDSFWAYTSLAGQHPESTLVGPIAWGETTSVTVILPPADSGDLFADYMLWATESHDPSHGNDSTRLGCWVFPRGTYAAEGFDLSAFPPPGWAVVSNDSGIQTWHQWSLPQRSHSGHGSAICSGETSRRNDDWLIDGPVCPTADDRDSLGFFTRSYARTGPTTLEVWAMNGPQVTDTLRLLRTLAVADTAYSRIAVSLDSLDGNTVWVGFRCRTSGTANALFLDDIWFSRVFVPGTSEPAAGVPIRPTLTIEPNPIAGTYATIRYSVPVGTRAKLDLRDVLGRAVTTIALDPSGFTRINLRGVAPGVYVATLEPSSPLISAKLIITAPR